VSEQSAWAVVLAAGDGTRLGRVTTDAQGVVVPKQFCRLVGDETMVATTLARAGRVVPAERTLVVVADKHRRWWEGALGPIPRENVLIQPANKGTAVGILLPLSVVLTRDPRATVITFPSDHHVLDEHTLEASIRGAVEAVRAVGKTVLLGMTPEAPEIGYGWIVPKGCHGRLLPVDAFAEKPDPDVARALMRAGALWNSFLFTGSVRHLLSLYDMACPGVREAFSQPLRDGEDMRDADRMARLYDALPYLDFSGDVLQRLPEELTAWRVPPCGWSDLGTPERLQRCLRSRTRRPGAGGRRVPTGDSPGRRDEQTGVRPVERPRPVVKPAARA
jgi:mannose-1-phosphate guanylyltransferase